MITKERVDKLLESHSYRFAKTMPQHPHAYSLRTEWKNGGIFEEAVQFIRDNSTMEYFFGKPYKMYYLNGYKYWTMGFPLYMTKLINRAQITSTDETIPEYETD